MGTKKTAVLDIACVLIMALQFDLFYLLSTEFKLGQGVLVIVSILYIIKYLKTKISYRDHNKYIIIYLCILMLTGAFQVTHLFGGSVISAFLAERVIWVYIIFYFALEKFFIKGKIDNEKCIRYLKIAGAIQLTLYFTQQILSGHVIFLHALSGVRYGSARFFFSPIMLILLLFVCVSDFFNDKRNISNIIWITLIIVEILVVQKYRMTTVAIAIAILCGFLMYRGNMSKGIGILFLGILAVAIMLNTPIGRDIIKSLLNQGTDNSLRGRAAWRIWAFDQLKIRPFLGNGFAYSQESYDYGAQHVRQLFSWSFTPGDYGIFGFIYEYGLLGAGWFIYFLIVQVKRALLVWKEKRCYTYIMFLTFIVIDSYSELYWIMSNGIFVLVIFMVMLKYECRSISYNKLYTTKKLDKVRFRNEVS